jgi:hypothetical protein
MWPHQPFCLVNSMSNEINTCTFFEYTKKNSAAFNIIEHNWQCLSADLFPWFVPRSLMLELKRMKDLQHEHIARFLGACLEPGKVIGPLLSTVQPCIAIGLLLSGARYNHES